MQDISFRSLFLEKVPVWTTFFILLLSLSCEMPQKKMDAETSTNQDTLISQETENLNSIKRAENPEGMADDCQEYINKYKKWIKDYIAVMEIYKMNPDNEEALNDYQRLVQIGKKLGEPTDLCTGVKEFQDSLLRITDVATTALEKYGIE